MIRRPPRSTHCISSAASDVYKRQVIKCEGQCISKSECPNYHSQSDKRRKVVLYKNGAWNYYPVMCKFKSKCKDEPCRYSHSQFETDYHPLSYKTQMCEYAESRVACLNFGEKCSCAHSGKDFRDIQLIVEELLSNSDSELVMGKCGYEGMDEFDVYLHKTVKCAKYNCKDYFNCLGYHNPLEQRRNIKEIHYEAVMCKFAFVNGKYVDPKDCIKGNKCTYCHTKNELYYHPKNFRTSYCHRKPCLYGKYCSDIHSESSLKPEDSEVLEKEYEGLKERLSKVKNLIAIADEYWICGKCKQLLMSSVHFLKDCGHKLCSTCVEDVKCSACDTKIEKKPVVIELINKAVAEEDKENTD
eukprot:TRINITY_DN14090_c0_g1_i2.p1 TRINITY_DN14090_c0_g1~~TRINITY_DN14090_c0_g1_i2.p1  ORF type:complete len:365 (-),score=52.50 TRINITY_DN14090_c0_g1_i2:102-1169(-)